MTRIVAATILVGGCAVPIDLGTVDTSGDASSGGTSLGEATGTPETMDGTSVGDTSTSTTTGDPSETDTTGTVESPHAFAIRLGDLPDVGSGSSDAGSSDAGSSDAGSSDAGTSDAGTDAGSEVGTDGTGGPTDPDALLVVATNGPASCAAPDARLSCPSSYRYSLVLPVSLQVAGAAGDLMDVGGTFFEAEGAGKECGAGGGTLGGQFEITFIDDRRVTGRLFDLDAFGPAPEIAFDARRCTP